MNAVMSIKTKHNLDAFLETGMFNTPEIRERRNERMRRDARMALRAAEYAQAEQRGYARAEAEAKQRERMLEDQHQEEKASLCASLAGGVALLAGLVGLAMMV